MIGRLSFVGYPERHGINALDLLFPKNQRYGKLDPPASNHTSGERVHRWRMIGRGDQMHIIDNPLPSDKAGFALNVTALGSGVSLLQQ